MKAYTDTNTLQVSPEEQSFLDGLSSFIATSACTLSVDEKTTQEAKLRLILRTLIRDSIQEFLRVKESTEIVPDHAGKRLKPLLKSLSKLGHTVDKYTKHLTKDQICVAELKIVSELQDRVDDILNKIS